jgi:glycosyltransferase involved in cell wall biosynthesis
MDHTRCHLVIVGGGPAFSDLKKALYGVPVTFTGYLTGEALAAAYASSDVFAFPSTTETFGQVVLEAMASGLPVVGLLAEGVRDLVTDEQTGLLLSREHLSEEEQVMEYRLRLSRLVHDQQARERMRLAALAAARMQTWPLAMEHLLRGYREVIEAKLPEPRRAA